MGKIYDLEDRTRAFAIAVHTYTRRISYHPATSKVLAQLMASAGSVGANYIEANEALSRKDFVYRIRVARKEAKEAKFWLATMEPVGEFEEMRKALFGESSELLKILSAIVNKVQGGSSTR